MKKIFAILLCSLLICTMAIPFVSHAAETSYYDVTFKSNIDYNGLKSFGSDLGDGFITIPLSFTCDGVHYDAIRFNSSNFMYYKGTSTPQAGRVSSGMWTWSDDKYKNIVITEPITNSAFLTWLDENSTYEAPTCDGTSCSWADDDFNGFCDTCGFALMSFRYDLKEYAESVAELGMTETFPDAQYYLINQGIIGGTNKEIYYIYISSTPFIYTGALANTSTYYVTEVALNSNDVPAYNGWTTRTSDRATDIAGLTPVSSNHDIDGFFPLSLQQTIQQTVKEGMTELTTQVVGTMRTLVLCGIGCLALLVVCGLFGKKFLLSLKK